MSSPAPTPRATQQLTGEERAAREPSQNPTSSSRGAAPEKRHSRSGSWFKLKRRPSTWQDKISPEPLALESDEPKRREGQDAGVDSDEEFWNAPRPTKRNSHRLQASETIDKSHFPQQYNRDALGHFDINTSSLQSRGKVSRKDGRLHLSMHDVSHKGYLAKTLNAGIRHHLRTVEGDQRRPSAQAKPVRQDSKVNVKTIPPENLPLPKLNIVVMVIGSRGDIQPFIKIGRLLKEKHGHRVRIATHPAFQEFVEKDCGLEFFSVGGNPSELMAFMVKNPGLIPNVDTILKGEIGRRRDQMAEMFEGFWRSCVDASDDPTDPQDGSGKPVFIADAIIANPPSFAHIHCAERLGCPLHIVFTFPYTPTQAFPHPLCNIKQSSADANYTNFMSYPLVEMMTWQGLGDLVNDFREDILGLDPVSTIWAPGQLYRMKVPYTYLWSPGLVPKPADWGPEVDIAGFVFLDLASHFKPPQDLEDFLNDGDKPIYIGFGSIVIDDPDKFTKMIFEAIDKAGVRAIINKGWGGIGAGAVPDNVFMIDNVPHDWLFPRCKAVVHHGGAGTTAIGLKLAMPTMIVPFFGDQAFWGTRVAEAKAGAFQCVPYKELTIDKFVEGIEQCLTDEAKSNVQKIADSIAAEGDGAENAVESFLAHLPVSGSKNLRCSVIQNRTAVWHLKDSHIRLSALAAELLISQKKIKKRDLRLLRLHQWNDFQGAGDPLTGLGSAFVKMIAGMTAPIGAAPFRIGRDVHRRASHQRRKISHEHRQKQRRRAQQANEEDAAKVQGSSERSSEREATEETSGADSSAQHPARPQLSRVGTNMPAVSTLNAATLAHTIEHESSAAAESDATEVEDQVSPESENANSNARHGSAQHLKSLQRQETDTSVMSAGPDGDIYHDVAREATAGVWKPINAVARFPMDLLLGLGNGFHNAPRLYGDTTVRRPIRISGMKSGFRAAGNELVLGTWDAFTGVVTQPYQGARTEGMLGFAKGFGKGLGGLVLKECAALTGPFGFAIQGMHCEALKWRTPIKAIRRRRHVQGQDDIEALLPEERKEAEEAARQGWKVMGHLWLQTQKVKQGRLVPGQGDQENTSKWIGDRLVAGVAGRITFAREKELWEQYGAFDSADKMHRFSEGRKRGYSHAEIAEQIRKESEERERQEDADHINQGTAKEHEEMKSRRVEAEREEREDADEPRQPELALVASPIKKLSTAQLDRGMDKVADMSMVAPVH